MCSNTHSVFDPNSFHRNALTLIPNCFHRNALTRNEKRWRCSFYASSIFYPVFMLTFKVEQKILSNLNLFSNLFQLGLLVNQGKATKWMAGLVKMSEVTFEALPQFTLQVKTIKQCIFSLGLQLGSFPKSLT